VTSDPDARTLGSLRDRLLAEAEALNAVTAASVGEDDPQRLLDATLEELTGLIPFTGGSLALVEGEELIIRAARGPFAEQALGQRAPRGGWSWRAVLEGTTLLSNDLLADGRKPSTPIRSFLAAPLKWRGRSVGLIEVDSTRPNAFSSGDARLLERVAAILAGPIELLARYHAEVRAVEEAGQARERLALLSEAGDLLSQSRDAESTFGSVARLMVPRLADWCAIYTVEAGPALPVAVTHYDPAKVDLLWEYLRHYPPDPEGPTGTARVLREGVMQAVQTVTDDMLVASATNDEQLTMLRALGIGSIAVVPMLAHERVVGAISLASREQGRHGPEDVALLAELARRAGLAVENALLFAEAQAARADLEQRVEERTREVAARNAALESLAAISRDLRVDADPRDVAGAILERLLGLLGKGLTVYHELDGEVWRPLAWRGEFPNEHLRDVFVAGLPTADTGRAREHISRGEPFYADAVSPEAAKPLFAGIGASASLPVIVGGSPRGLLAVVLPERRTWSREDRALLEAVADGLGSALERAQFIERLGRQSRELEERNAEQETFIYTVSHDLRTPLLSINGMADLLLEAVRAGDRDESEFLVVRVQRNVDRMGQLLSDLLDLSRIGRLDEVARSLDLGDSVMTALAQVADRISARGLELSGPDEWPSVHYPQSELEQVLTNLIGNAVKWAGRDGERPRVRLGVEREGERVMLRVDDNGPGVPPRYRERVFGLFQRLDPSAEGTGVGLAIVKRIAERNGGRAWVEDSDLGGASFRLTLPAA
jgi:signal transduction histidine kinase/putative methionine-R-sulfoxide reductase with GAF domain